MGLGSESRPISAMADRTSEASASVVNSAETVSRSVAIAAVSQKNSAPAEDVSAETGAARRSSPVFRPGVACSPGMLTPSIDPGWIHRPYNFAGHDQILASLDA